MSYNWDRGQREYAIIKKNKKGSIFFIFPTNKALIPTMDHERKSGST